MTTRGTRRKPSIWAIEGVLPADASDVHSIGPVLEMLDAAHMAEFVHHRVTTAAEVRGSLKKWSQTPKYEIGYLDLRGEPGVVWVGSEEIDLLDLAEELPAGCLDDRVLHLGSSAVVDEDSIDQVREALGLRVLSAFTEEVPWFTGVAFELILLEQLANTDRTQNAQRTLRQKYGDLAEELGLIVSRAPM